MRVQVLDDDGYECKVQSASDPSIWYEVNLEHSTCSCPHFTYRKVKCKHIKEALVAVERKFAERVGPAGGSRDDERVVEISVADETAKADAESLANMEDPFDLVWGDEK